VIFDSNVHITADGRWFTSTLDASVNHLLVQMDNASIERSLVVPLPGTISNEQSLKICGAHADRLHAAYSFNPALHSDEDAAGSHFEKDILSLPFSLVKFHNRFGKYAPNDERFIRVMEVNNAAKKPHVIMICGYLNDRNSSYYQDPVSYFFDLAIRFKNTTFVVGHSGGPFLLQLAESCKDLSNIYFDLSYAIHRYRHSSLEMDLRWMCGKLDRKIIWGSDFPEVEQMSALNDLKEITTGIDAEKVANMTGKNLQKILEL
jgi:predicted TIM-barrel fold metal-dependent hydrolase